MSMWVQSEKFIDAFLHGISTKSIQAPGRPPFIMLHHPPTIEASTRPTKKSCYSKNCTQFNSLPSDLLYNIFMGHAGLSCRKKIKPVLVQLTQHNPVLRLYKSYNSNMSHLMCGHTYALDLTHPTVTANEKISSYQR